jgi:hypothetical protein
LSTVYCVNIRWVKTTMDPPRIDAALTSYGDWIRFDGWTWLVATDNVAQNIVAALRTILVPEDNILVIKCDPNDYGGWAQQWVWDWINRQRSPSLSQFGGAQNTIAAQGSLGSLFGPPKR